MATIHEAGATGEDGAAERASSRGGRDVFIDLVKAVEALGIVALHTAMDRIVPLDSGVPQVDVGWWLS